MLLFQFVSCVTQGLSIGTANLYPKNSSKQKCKTMVIHYNCSRSGCLRWKSIYFATSAFINPLIHPSTSTNVRQQGAHNLHGRCPKPIRICIPTTDNLILQRSFVVMLALYSSQIIITHHKPHKYSRGKQWLHFMRLRKIAVVNLQAIIADYNLSKYFRPYVIAYKINAYTRKKITLIQLQTIVPYCAQKRVTSLENKI